MDKSYSPTSFEEKLYQEWEAKGYFKAKDLDPKPPFTIPLPPPNVTGALHIGHALVTTLEDTLTRWKRMSGFNALWMPGTDHAGIATQMVVERELAKQKVTRQQLGREDFLKKVWEWKEKHGEIIVRQMKKLGASCDWDRAQFTMSPTYSKAVREVFVRLYQEGLLYRGARITSRCLRCETVLSDLEVISKEKKSNLWHIRYSTKDGKHSVVIATTRPETLLGDTAVAVHPEDDRYRSLHGLKLVVPFVNREVPVILDSYVDPAFGTGALKVTPAHDINDFELGKKHQLASISIIDLNGKLNAHAGQFQGLKVAEARDKVVAELEAQGLLVKTEEITNQVGHCQRCDSVVEPLISDQWFMKMKPMADRVMAAAKLGETLSLDEVDKRDDCFKIVPDQWQSTFYHWMENIRDWCVSRQLWWGHRIPAWYCRDCNHISVSLTDIANCTRCQSKAITQDEDVLDTWFSSGLWPFAGLGWPEKTPAYQTFYPAAVLETGFDILFFWVARMLMLGMHFNDGKVPFHRVYLHAMVRDEKGQKMSKTKGNVVDPLDLIRDYGADAFRFSLMAMSGQGRDLRLSLDRVEGYQAFCNKLWNASRFVWMRISSPESFTAVLGAEKPEEWIEKNRSHMHVVNRWLLARIEDSSSKVDKALENFKMAEAAQEIYALLWHDYCDWYIEFSKELLKDPKLVAETQICMGFGLQQILLLAHPFIPFISEEIFKNLPVALQGGMETLMKGPYPKVKGTYRDEKSLAMVAVWQDAIEKVRTFRGENNISPKANPEATYEVKSEFKENFEQGIPFMMALAHLGGLKPETGTLKGKKETGEVLSKSATFHIPLQGLVDFTEEKKRLEKQKETLQNGIRHVETILSRADFVAKAPPQLVETEKKKLENFKQELASVEKALARLS